MLKSTPVMQQGNESKGEKERQESFAKWLARSRLEFDCDGERRRARETADKHHLL